MKNLIKKTKIILMIISTASLLFACSSDSNSTQNTQVSLINKWFINKWVYNNVNRTLTECDKQGYIKFNSDGTFERKTYNLNGTNCESDSVDNGTYTFNTTANKIIINFDDPDEGAQVETYNNVELTNTTLKYTWDEDGNGTDEYNLEFNK
ncbi:lipocalin family protein [Flavobacterium sp. CYK-55]|uniref:lipocalin family protein n=1 Tax=Flavobacterium sp. CYK-55 TaxID=2835529 RepID=UPI001BCB4790|nr:lipocalin family protein [Flavobacterium sp. CYK-55]MBS7786623.1 lipocalin family protein [Flavobacterium sp. CYK-55]